MEKFSEKRVENGTFDRKKYTLIGDVFRRISHHASFCDVGENSTLNRCWCGKSVANGQNRTICEVPGSVPVDAFLKPPPNFIVQFPNSSSFSFTEQ